MQTCTSQPFLYRNVLWNALLKVFLHSNSEWPSAFYTYSMTIIQNINVLTSFSLPWASLSTLKWPSHFVLLRAWEQNHKKTYLWNYNLLDCSIGAAQLNRKGAMGENPPFGLKGGHNFFLLPGMSLRSLLDKWPVCETITCIPAMVDYS